MNRIVDAVQRAGVRPIVASPDPPPTLAAKEDWIPLRTKSLRAVLHNWRQMRRVAAIGRRMGGTVFIDLYLDKNAWAAGALTSFGRRVHVLHHSGQYTTRRGWAGIRTTILRRHLRQITEGGAKVLVHTRRAAATIEDAVGTANVEIVGYPVLTSPTRSDRPHHGRPNLLFVGAGRRDKGLDLLIDALPLIQGRVALRVVGAQPNGVRRILDPGNSPSIIWIDRRVTDEELRDEYENASLAILPYRQSFGEEGGASGVLLEVLGYGRPIVTTPALRSQLPPDGRGAEVAESDDPSDLARAIDLALQRLDDLSREAAEVGPAFIAENHTYDRYVEALAAAANSVLP